MLRVATATAPSCEDRVAVRKIPGGVAVIVADGDAARRVVELAQRGMSAHGFDALSARAHVNLLCEIDRDLRSGDASAVSLTVWQRHIWGASVGDCSALVAHERGLDDLTENRIRWSRIGTGNARPVPFERGEWDGCVVMASGNLVGNVGPAAVRRVVFEGDIERAARRLVQRMGASQGEQTPDVTVATVRWADR